MTASKRVSRVDVSVTGDTENSCVSFASNRSWCLLADLTHPHPLMPGHDFAIHLAMVNLVITIQTQKSRVGPAKRSCSRGFARVTTFSRNTPSSG
ncbi:hypothetical protein NC651_038809 [Populus alba x Populus x berolinensis]|nr:hypothetical protein NC651_038809 [Populus alba x Populus x berolinensis]